ncbi:MAG TPA: glycine cleavage system aminomethyltransferase GcvT, partial [Thermomicrobiales bacterium]|nr:glycine cleavage system aminomethyltransferase GcvT [Thermomicrobiales bacterium]
IVYRGPSSEPSTSDYMVVVNASNREKDIDWLEERLAERTDLDARVADVSDRLGMIAIQGPRAEGIVAPLTDVDLSNLESFRWSDATVAGIPTRIARTGYTGEDGFEFYVPDEHTRTLWDALLAAGQPHGLTPIGLGARDTLRLEARMPLYGQELGDDIGPLEAGLGWAVALEKGDFVGRDPIARMKETGPPRRTVGFRLVERSGAPRHGYPVFAGGRRVGHVTSGALSPTLGANIGLALVERDAAGVGKPLAVEVRGRQVQAEQVKLPFYRRAGAATSGS